MLTQLRNTHAAVPIKSRPRDRIVDDRCGHAPIRGDRVHIIVALRTPVTLDVRGRILMEIFIFMYSLFIGVSGRGGGGQLQRGCRWKGVGGNGRTRGRRQQCKNNKSRPQGMFMCSLRCVARLPVRSTCDCLITWKCR